MEFLRCCELVPGEIIDRDGGRKVLCTVLPDERKAGFVFLYDCHTWWRACIRYCHGFFADDLCIGGPAVYLPVFYSDGGLSFLHQTDARADQKRSAGTGLKYVCSNIGIVLYG